MGKVHKGSCLCGRVKFEIIGEFQSFFLCYCTRCQKDTGSAHAANLFAQDSKLVWAQGETYVKTYQHPHTLHSKSFCQNCGSTLPTVAENIQCIVTPAGSLDGPVPISPTAKIFVGSCANWTKNLSQVPSFEQLPEQNKN
ncbi:aldehyde-activating protein [Vibrio natriegens]|uniref:GFA family protein n=1 Tax=Vibrio natriegens TaxID=691 RepID=UPI0008042C4D|nr:GFA family protein [Vibrio natriegens]ANQ21846.1 aldehyde-activating protein [Vibrio natriegens]